MSWQDETPAWRASAWRSSTVRRCLGLWGPRGRGRRTLLPAACSAGCAEGQGAAPGTGQRARRCPPQRGARRARRGRRPWRTLKLAPAPATNPAPRAPGRCCARLGREKLRQSPVADEMDSGRGAQEPVLGRRPPAPRRTRRVGPDWVSRSRHLGAGARRRGCRGPAPRLASSASAVSAAGGRAPRPAASGRGRACGRTAVCSAA